MTRTRISSGGPWEAKGGYSRAFRVGHHIAVSGSTSMRDGAVVGVGDPAAQARQALATIASALEDAGGRVEDVVRYRVYLTRIDDWQDVLPVLGEVFGEIRPAGTLVAVSALIHPDLIVEIEVDAIVDQERRR